MKRQHDRMSYVISSIMADTNFDGIDKNDISNMTLDEIVTGGYNNEKMRLTRMVQNRGYIGGRII